MSTDVIKTLFEQHFHAPPTRVLPLQGELGGSGRKIIRLANEKSTVIGILYGSFCSLAQDDLKKLVAYSSVAHLGFCMLGLFALNETGLSGGLLDRGGSGIEGGGEDRVGMVEVLAHAGMLAALAGEHERGLARPGPGGAADHGRALTAREPADLLDDGQRADGGIAAVRPRN